MRRSLAGRLALATACALLPSTLSPAALAQPAPRDAEAGTHGFEAARHRVVDVYRFEGFEVVQFDLPVLSHFSYLLVSGGEGLLVDPDRDIDAYRKYASENGVSVRGVLLTHSHADFVAGHLEAARAFGCKVFQSALSGAKYPFEGLRDLSTIRIGSAVVRALETPGHTPDGICALVPSFGGTGDAAALFTGDTLFVGSVGRPDLLEGTMSAAELASLAFDSWHDQLSALTNDVRIFPAHGAGSLCGAHLSDRPTSTVGEERASNPYLRHYDRSAFVAAVLEGLPEAPQYFRHDAAMNREGPPFLDPAGPKASEAAPESAMKDPARFVVVDLRDAAAYAAGHVPRSLNIGLRGRLETWVGILVPWGSNLVVVGSDEEIAEAARRLARVGYEAAGLRWEDWAASGLPTARSGRLAPRALFEAMEALRAPLLVDVRLPEEAKGLAIGPAVNLPLAHLRELSSKLAPDQPVVTVCNSAYRSSMAVGILEARGIENIASLEGGTEAWVEAGLPTSGEGPTPPASSPGGVAVRLADRLDPSELHRLILDLPGSFEIVDIRPAEFFADYSIPGSRNVPIGELLGGEEFRTGTIPLVVVDRDGSLAMQAAAILAQRTHRPVKALHGGLEAYWIETELRPAVRAVPLPAAPPEGAATPPAPGGPPAAPEKPAKKKSAGC